jgi:opacity protein-like surface antigen
MGSLKTLAMAGVVLAGATTVAAAADLRGHAPIGLPPPPVAMPIAESSGWYLRGDIGVGMVDGRKFNYSDNDPAFDFTSKQFDPQFFTGVGVGYQFNSWFRADLTAEYRFASRMTAHDRYFAAGGPAPGDFVSGTNVLRSRLSSWVVMANGYLDLGTWHGLTPYIGAGAGYASKHVAAGTDIGTNYNIQNNVVSGGYGTATFGSGTKSGFAWALMAGVSADVSQNLKLDVGYRYLNLGKIQSGAFSCCPGVTLENKNIDSHEVRVGLRWMFGGPSVASAPVAYPPMVTKKF